MNYPITIDTIEINSLVAAQPERLVVELEREPLNGLWQLLLVDMESGLEWRLGHYIDHYETREVELRDELAAETPLSGPGETAWSGKQSRIVATGSAIRVEVGTMKLAYPRLCPFVQHALDAPVYLGTTAEGRWFLLDCFGGRRAYPGSMEGLEREVRARACHCGAIHWFTWHVVRDGEIVETHYAQARPHEVVEVLRRALGA